MQNRQDVKDVNKKPYQETIEREFAFLLEGGFSYEYLYDKGSDSSCVYIYRFRKGRDFLDFRTVSGGKEKNVVVFALGEYAFPNLRLRHKKEFREFSLKHIFKKATTEELWHLAADLIRKETESGTLFSIPL
jgi:hypothetical protein